MLAGLEEYGSDESPAAEAVSVLAPAAPAAAQPSRSLLSIADYGPEPDEAERMAQRQGAERLGVSLDEDEVDRGAGPTSRVGGIGVQVSVVKRTVLGGMLTASSASKVVAGSSDGDAEGTSSGALVANGAGDNGTRPAFVVPDSPPGELNPRTMEKYLGYVAAAKEGNKINDHIRHSKKFRNPCLLDKLVAYLGVQEFGTNYPPELYDPSAFGRDEHYDALEEARREWEHKQSRKQGEKVDFRSAGSQPPAAPVAGVSAAVNAAAVAAASAAAAAATAAPSAAGAEAAPVKRKSKWDSGGDKQRPRQ